MLHPDPRLPSGDLCDPHLHVQINQKTVFIGKALKKSGWQGEMDIFLRSQDQYNPPGTLQLLLHPKEACHGNRACLGRTPFAAVLDPLFNERTQH